MKLNPTSEQVHGWSSEYLHKPFADTYQIGLREHIAQRAAEWASAQSAERIAELERQRGKLLDALIHLHHNARASGAEMGLALDFASEAIAEVRGEK